MKKALVVMVIIVILGGGAYALSRDNKSGNNSTSSDNTPAPSAQTDQTNPATTNPASTTDSDDQASNSTADVQIKDFAFGPTKLTVKAGTTVTWTQQDDTEHDIIPDEESDNFKGSNLLSKGQTYSFTFTKAGTYTYHCGPHPYMKGTIEVTD